MEKVFSLAENLWTNEWMNSLKIAVSNLLSANMLWQGFRITHKKWINFPSIELSISQCIKGIIHLQFTPHLGVVLFFYT